MSDDEFWTNMFLSWVVGCSIFLIFAFAYMAVFE